MLLSSGHFQKRVVMSEYQYYEFCRINTPLTLDARKEMASLSSRGHVGTHNASYVYNYVNFRGNNKQLLLKYFDVFFYISNYGTVNLVFKYPYQELNLTEINKYCIKHVISCEQYEQYVILDVSIRREGGFGWIEGEEFLPELLPLYEEIKSNNYKFLLLVAAIHDEYNDEAKDCMTTIGNMELSSAQEAFLSTIGITNHVR